MSTGDDFLQATPLKTRFYDRYEERAYARAVTIARGIVERPDSVALAVSFIDKHFRSDPQQKAAYQVWSKLLREPPEEIARALLEDSEQGAELRGSAPVFVVLPSAQRLDLLR